MKQSNVQKLPRWGKWISGIALMSVALAAAGLSLTFNVIAGLSFGIPVAVMFGLSDVGKVLIPIVCQAIGWNKHLKATYWVAAFVSIVCALLAASDMLGLRLATVDVAAKDGQMVTQHIEDLRSSLETARQMALAESQRGGCGPKCQALNDRVSQLESSINSAVEKETEKSKPAITGLGFLGTQVLGFDPSSIDVSRAILVALLGIVMMELLCHLSGPSASMIGMAMKRTPKKVKVVDTKKVEETIEELVVEEEPEVVVSPRSVAVKKSWETRRKQQRAAQKKEKTEMRKRSDAAKKGWETRRKRASEKNEVRSDWTKIDAYAATKELETV